MHLLALTISLLTLILELQSQFLSAQETETSEKKISQRDGKADNVSQQVPKPIRRQIQGGSPSFDGRNNYQQFSSLGLGTPGVGGGLNYGLVGINGGVNPCLTCSAADYSLAQKCCSFGQRGCCNVNTNQIYPQPVVFTSGGNNGFGFQNSYPSTWRPSSGLGFGGITYDTQYNQAGGGYSGFNRGEKPGICYRGSYLNQGGYAGQGGYQSVSFPQTSYGSSGGYYPQSHQGHGGNYAYRVPVYNQNQNRYCRTDYECTGNQKCCTGVCSNPAFYA